MYEARIPVSGDILFLKSHKIHGVAIARTQKRMGLKHYEYMHAALVVGSDLILESTTKYGFRKVRLSTLDDPSDYFNATVLRKSSVESPFVGEDMEKSLKAAYSFYKEAYDWRGILMRDALSEGRSICSAFVKNALLLSKREQSATFVDYRAKIYPAELYSALIKAEYQKLAHGYDLEYWTQLQFDSHKFDAVDLMEASLTNTKSWNDLSRTLRRAAQDADAILDKELLTTPADLSRLLTVFEATNQSFLEVVHHYFAGILHNFGNIEQQISRRPMNWRDNSQYRETLGFQWEVTVSHCESTLTLVNAFCEAFPKSTIQGEDFASMTDNDRLEFTKKVFKDIRQRMIETLLVAGASDLDDLDARVSDSWNRLRSYQNDIANFSFVKNIGFPYPDDQYQTVIEILEASLTEFRKHEQTLGKMSFSEIANTAKIGVERFRSAVRQLGF